MYSMPHTSHSPRPASYRWSHRAYCSLLALLATPALAAARPAPPSPQKSAKFDVTAVHSRPGVQVTLHSQLWVTASQARAQVSDPVVGDKLYLITQGCLYQLDPKTKRGVKEPLPRAFTKNPDNLVEMVRRFTLDASAVLPQAKKGQAERVGGHLCDVYTTTQRQGAATREIRLWMPRELTPKLPLKAVRTEKLDQGGALGAQTISITLSNLVLNAAIPAATFAVPAGYQIERPSEQTAPTPVPAPAPQQKRP